MSFISELQTDIASEKPIGPILMRLRLLAAKLGSAPLADWVRFETEGYPNEIDLPDYRIQGMSFIGQFSGPFGSSMKNAPIPPVLIKTIAGDDWEHFNVRYSAAGIDSIINQGNGVTLDLANLALLIQGKVYEGMACNQLTGFISHSAFIEISNTIRNRALELTIGLEKELPEASSAELSQFQENTATATQVFQQTVYGGITNIQNSGAHQRIVLSIKKADSDSLFEALSGAGLYDEEVETLGGLIAEEPLQSDGKGNHDFGDNLRKWLGERITKGTDSGLKGGIAALTSVAKEAAMQYWGLK